MKHIRKLLNVQQTRAADQYTIENRPISSLALMENAARAFVSAFEKQNIEKKKILVVCGIGNNGGDGLAVCRLLRDRSIDAEAVLVMFKDKLSSDCLANKNRLNAVSVVDSISNLPDLHGFDIIIDAIFGSGLNSSVKGLPAQVIHAINKSGKEVYAIDVPSGLFCDTLTQGDTVVQSAHVICFQRPKLSFFYPEHSKFIKSWEVVDIGLDETFIQSQISNHFILNHFVSKLLKPRPRQSHKGTYGHAILMAGSYGKMGATILAAKACLRSGVGLLSCYVPKSGYEIMQISVPEAMCLTDNNMSMLSEIPNFSQFSAVGIGCGIGTEKITANMLKTMLQSCTKPLVIDADAINILAANRELISLLPKQTILTPHIKEFDRLVGESNTSVERFRKLQLFSKENQCIVVLKDANSCISSPEQQLFFNTSGNQGMATGGSGDVLTGVITGLLAQNYDPLSAAIIGVYFHGKAGDIAVEKRSYSALIASDIIEHLNIETMK